jgi:hypothetical protein
MKLDLQYEGVRYVLDFEDVDAGPESFLLKVYYSLDSDSSYGASMKQIKDNKIVWSLWDEERVSKKTRDYLDRVVKLLVFA